MPPVLQLDDPDAGGGAGDQVEPCSGPQPASCFRRHCARKSSLPGQTTRLRTRSAASSTIASPWPTPTTFASRPAMRRTEAACCSLFRLNARQPAENCGQVAIASPAIRKLRSGQVNARSPASGRPRATPERPDPVALAHRLVDVAGRVLRSVEREPDLEGQDLDRLHRLQRHGLGAPVARDDVRLPFVRVHGRAAQPLQHGQPAQVRAVRVRDHDVAQLVRPTAERGSRLQHEPGVALEERVDERQLVAVVDEERPHAAALLVAEGVHAGHELPQAPPPASTARSRS